MKTLLTASLVAGSAFGVSCLLCWCIYPILLKAAVIDAPNARSSHRHPTVRGGGVAIVATIVIGLLWLRAGHDRTAVGVIIVLLGLLATVSFLDDVRSVGIGKRFATHAFAATGAIAVLWGITPASVWGLTPSDAVALVLSFVWITGYTNAFNFMDGINGIAAGQAALTGVGSALIIQMSSGSPQPPAAALGALLLGGAAGGFIPYNYPRARMFMGDVGSAPLGYFLAVLVLWAARDVGESLIIPLVLLHTNFLVDTGVTLIRRVLRREQWYKPHREHFYQRLVRSGKSHTSVTGFEMALQGCVCSMMLVYVRAGLAWRLWLALAVLALWALFFAYCEFEFRREGNSSVAPPSDALPSSSHLGT